MVHNSSSNFTQNHIVHVKCVVPCLQLEWASTCSHASLPASSVSDDDGNLEHPVDKLHDTDETEAQEQVGHTPYKH